MTKVAIQIDGTWTDASKVVWLFCQPCGCPFGVMSAGAADRVFAATEEQAWREFYDTRKEREKAVRQGVTCFAVTFERYKADFPRAAFGEHTCELGPVDRSHELPGQLDLFSGSAALS